MEVWDRIRKKWLVLTPEEWVRQNWINHLISAHLFPEGHISVEKTFNLNGQAKRFDLVAGYPPQVLIECKAPNVPLSQSTFDQLARYNTILKIPFLIISNGLVHLYFEMTPDFSNVRQINTLPTFHQ